jgi:hypothetical protein
VVTAEDGTTRTYTVNITRPASTTATLFDLALDGETLDGFDPNVFVYTATIADPTQSDALVEYTKMNEFQTVSGGGTLSVAYGQNSVDIYVTSEDGSVTNTYTILVTKDYTTKLQSLAVMNYALAPAFDPSVFDYDLTIFNGVMSLAVLPVPYDPSASVVISGAGYIPASGGIVTIVVSRAGAADSIYTINVAKSSTGVIAPQNFPCIADVQYYIAPMTSTYILETWGAEGGTRGTANAGKGGYAKGTVALEAGERVYVYTGCSGDSGGNAGGWNGGGARTSGGTLAGGGGGTDIRVGGQALTDRIIVAGGGGSVGATNRPGGAGGGLTGVSRTEYYGGGGAGGTQTAGGAGGGGCSLAGSFGVGGAGCYRAGGYGGAGGGGWFGGGGVYPDGSVDDDRGGGGGSGYVFTSSSNVAGYGGSVPDTKYYLTDTVLSAGTVKFNSPTGTQETGHAGSGFARITPIAPPSDDNSLIDLVMSDGTLQPTFDPSSPNNEYTVAVPSYAEKVMVTTATASDANATVLGEGVEYILPAGVPVVIPITVTAESGLVRTYNVTATRAADTNSTPSMILLGALPSNLCKANGTGSCRFNDVSGNSTFFGSATLEYWINIPTLTRKLNFTVNKGRLFQDVSATVNGEPANCTIVNDNPTANASVECANIPMGNSDVTITVTAEDGSSTTYTFHIYRTPGADLENILVVQPDYLDEDMLHYSSLATDYGVSGNPDAENIVLEIIADPSITVQVKLGQNGTYEDCPNLLCEVDGLVVKQNDIWIQATMNGMVKTYYINWYRQLSSNTFLATLEVQNKDDATTTYDLSPTFNSRTETYTVQVPYATECVNIVATPEVGLTTVSGDTGNFCLTVGNNVATITTRAEDSAQGQYTLNIIRARNPNANVEAVIISNALADYTPTFDIDTTEYYLDLDPHQNKLDFVAIHMESSDATYRVLGNANLTVGDSVVTVQGVAADGTTKDYHFNVHIDPSPDAELLTLNTDVYDLSGEFTPDNFNYSFIVGNANSSVTIFATSHDPLAQVFGEGNFPLLVGTNAFTVTVMAQDGSVQDYYLQIIREPNDDATFATFTITGAGNIQYSEPFDPQVFYYEIIVENTTTEVLATATPAAPTSIAYGDLNGIWPLVVGDNYYATSIVAESGATNTYNFKITRVESPNDCLATLSLQEARISPAFTCQNLNYTAQVPYWIDRITPVYTVAEPNATVVVGDTELAVGANIITVEVTSEDGLHKREYQITVTRNDDTANDSRAAIITTDKGAWNEPFDASKLYYEVSVGVNDTAITIDGQVIDVDGGATISGLGTFPLAKGDNLFEVEVEATDGTQTTYTLLVKRAFSAESRLQTLSVSSATLAPGFNRDVLTYAVTGDQTSLTLASIVPLDAGASYQVFGNGQFDMGANVVDIVVTAENGINQTTYTIVYTRVPSNNNYLSSLSLDRFNFTAAFKKTTRTYTVAGQVDQHTDKIKIFATAEDPRATISGDGEVQLAYGKNLFTVTVTAESGAISTYTISITRALSDNNELADIIVSDGSLSPAFAAGTLNYTVDIDYLDTAIDITPVLASANATLIAGGGTVQLPNETTVHTIQVKAMNGSVRTYTVTINRNQNYPSTLDNLTAAPYTLDQTFNSALLNYSMEVDFEIDDVSKIPFNFVKTDPNASVVVSSGALAVGPNTVTVEVTARDGSSTTTYEIMVIRRAYSNTFLLYLMTDQADDITPDFVKENLIYSMTVPNGLASLKVAAEPESPDSTVSVGGVIGDEWTIPLNYGANTVTLTVTSTTGIKRNYNLNIFRTLSDITDTSGFTFRAGTVSLKTCVAGSLDADGGFIPDTADCVYHGGGDSYTVNVPKGTTEGSINFTKTDPNSTITGNGTFAVVAGRSGNVHKVVVTAQDGTTREITVEFVRPRYDLNHLIALAPSVGTMSPNFDYDQTQYTVYVPGRFSTLSFTATAEDSLYATIVGLDPDLVPSGTSQRQIVVTAEDGQMRQYDITVVHLDDAEARLQSLVIDGQTITFDPDTFSYNITVPNSKTVFLPSDISDATPIDSAATVTKDGALTLRPMGGNVYQILVMAEDGVTSHVYKINIYRTPLTDAWLSDIKIDGVSIPNFDPATFTYNVQVAYNYDGQWGGITGLGIAGNNTMTVGTPTYKKTGIKWNCTPPSLLNSYWECSSEMQITLTAIAEDGVTTQTYIVNVSRAPAIDNRLASWGQSGGRLTPIMNPDTKNYTLTVPTTLSAITLQPTLVNSSATFEISVDGGAYQPISQVLISGLTPDTDVNVRVRVNSNLGANVYTMTVHMGKSPDNSVGSITLDDLTNGTSVAVAGVLGTGAKPAGNTYTAVVANSVTEVEISDLTAFDTLAQGVTGLGAYSLNVGNNTIPFTVTAEDGTVENYSLVVRRLDNVGVFATFAASGITFDQTIDPTTTSYTALISDTITSTTLATTAVSSATISGNGNGLWNLTNLGAVANERTVRVEAENCAAIYASVPNNTCDATDYTISIRRADTSVGWIDVVGDNGLDYSPNVTGGVKPSQNTYSIVVPNAVASVDVDITANSNLAQGETGDGTYSLAVGSNTIPFTITAEDGVVENYTLIVKRLNGTSTLSNLTVQGIALDPTFDPATTAYAMTVPFTTTSTTVGATASESSATLTGAGTWNLTNTGTTINVRNVIVSAEDCGAAYSTVPGNVCNQTTYSIGIMRTAAEDDKELVTLTVDGVEVDNFDPAVFSYNLPMRDEFTTSAVIAATASGQFAVVSGDLGQQTLVKGANQFQVRVTAEDGSYNIYYLNIPRAKNTDVALADLTVDGTTIDNFDPAVFNYTMTVPYTTLSLDIGATANSALANLSGCSGQFNLGIGANVCTVTVTAEDGTTQDYTITITRTAPDTNNDLTDLAVDGVTVPGYDPSVYVYNLGSVPHDKDSVVITAGILPPGVILNGTGTIPLASRDNNLLVQTQAEDGNIATYVIQIYREPGDNETLANLIVRNHVLTNVFQPYNNVYYVVTSSATTHASLDIIPILSEPSEQSYQIIYDQTEFAIGTNIVRIIVTAEDGSERTYYLNVVLQRADQNFHLASLNTDLHEMMLTNEFDPNKYDYNFQVPITETNICVTATAESVQATIFGAQDLNDLAAVPVCYTLDVGINTITVSVVAGDGTVQDYIITVVRDGSAGIHKIVAVPENRYPAIGNSNTWFLIEIVEAGKPYAGGANVIWDNRQDILNGVVFQTDEHGEWDAATLGVNPMEVPVVEGDYDVYFTGYSHLSRVKRDVHFTDGVTIEIDFTYDEATIAAMKSNGTLLSSDPMRPLLAGDAGVAEDSDGTCGPIASACVVGGMFSGDEWGDDEVNSLDVSAVLSKLYQTGMTTQQILTAISKEDLDGNGEINSLDMSMTLNNLYMKGDR